MTDKQIVASVRRARQHLKAATGYNPEGPHYIAVLTELALLEQEHLPPKLPNLGKVDEEGGSILDMDFTHLTTGLGWPAFDTNFGAGDTFLAPEDMVVDTKDSSAHPGEAIYCTGKSGIRYWFAHLQDDHPLGKKFLKGQVVGKTIATNIGGGPHLHLAINIIPLTGRHARYGRDGNGPDYTHGPYTLRTELSRGR